MASPTESPACSSAVTGLLRRHAQQSSRLLGTRACLPQDAGNCTWKVPDASSTSPAPLHAMRLSPVAQAGCSGFTVLPDLGQVVLILLLGEHARRALAAVRCGRRHARACKSGCYQGSKILAEPTAICGP